MYVHRNDEDEKYPNSFGKREDALTNPECSSLFSSFEKRVRVYVTVRTHRKKLMKLDGKKRSCMYACFILKIIPLKS